MYKYRRIKTIFGFDDVTDTDVHIELICVGPISVLISSM